MDNPSDPGGRTNMGVTQKTYNAWRTEQGLPQQDVWEMKRDECFTIYYKKYWNIEWEKLGLPLAACMLDTSIHSGPARAQAFLKKSDGDYVKYLQLRIAFLKELIQSRPTLKVFEKGWMNRMTDLRRFIDQEIQANAQWANPIPVTGGSVG